MIIPGKFNTERATRCSSSSPRSGFDWRPVQTRRRDRADRGDAAAATSASCSGRTSSSAARGSSTIPRRVSRSRQHHPGQPAQPERDRAAQDVSAPDSRASSRARTTDPEQPEPARHAEGHGAPRLPADQRTTTCRSGTATSTGSPSTPSAATFPLARTDWDRPNTTVAASWTSTLKSNLINEFTYGYALDEVYINVFREGGLYERSKYGINYPYVFRRRRSSTRSRRSPSRTSGPSTAGRTRPARWGPIHTWSNNVTWVKGRHTFKAGVFIEYSGENDFDQINVTALPGDTNNQNGRFEFTDGRAGGTGPGDGERRAGPVHQLRRDRTARVDQVARARRPTSSSRTAGSRRDALTVEYGTRYVIWRPWYAQLNNAAMFYPRLLRSGERSARDRSYRPDRS